MTEYAKKAELYHAYRWDYCQEAIQYILAMMDTNDAPVVVDMGAGTGKLTQHFVPHVHCIYAVEPDSNMLAILADCLSSKVVIPLQRFAHDIPEIPDSTVDVILAAHAIHWFDFEKTRVEFNRIARPICRLVLVSNADMTQGDFPSETRRLLNQYKNTTVIEKQDHDNMGNYFERETIAEAHFDADTSLTFEAYLGSMMSTSYMPCPDDPMFPDLRDDAQAVFSKYADHGKIATKTRTTVMSGQLLRL